MNLNATILGQAISFILFVWFCMKYIWPPITLAIVTRQKEIKKALKSSEEAKKELNIIQEKMDQKIKETKEKATLILNEAYKQKELILEEAKKNAIEESKSIIMKTQSEIEIEIELARKNLRKEIIDLSISMAEKIIKKKIQKKQNENLINELSFSLSQVKN